MTDDTDYEIITSPVTDWTSVKLDPRVHDPLMYVLEPPTSHSSIPVIRCLPHCGNWSLGLVWVDGSYKVDTPTGAAPVTLVRDLSEIRAKRNRLLDQAAAYGSYPTLRFNEILEESKELGKLLGGPDSHR